MAHPSHIFGSFRGCLHVCGSDVPNLARGRSGSSWNWATTAKVSTRGDLVVWKFSCRNVLLKLFRGMELLEISVEDAHPTRASRRPLHETQPRNRPERKPAPKK